MPEPGDALTSLSGECVVGALAMYVRALETIPPLVSFGRIFPEQQEMMDRLDAQRAWHSLSTGQQTERLVRAKRAEEGQKKAA